jgi:hypothetical protein
MSQNLAECIELPEIPILTKKFKCDYCNKHFKSKKGHKNHIKKFHSNNVRDFTIDDNDNDNDIISEEDIANLLDIEDFQSPDKEFLKLKQELENIILNNPSINIDEPVNTLVLEKINNMSIEEIKARIFHAKRALNSKLDCKISDGALGIVNQVVGRLLGCVDELESAVMSDDLLRQSTKDLLSMNILTKIPSQIKVAGLYSVNVGYALNQAKNKINKFQNTNIEEATNV